MKRENSLDIVRGIVMIIMAFDHVRDLMHVDSITQSPTDLQRQYCFLRDGLRICVRLLLFFWRELLFIFR